MARKSATKVIALHDSVEFGMRTPTPPVDAAAAAAAGEPQLRRDR